MQYKEQINSCEKSIQEDYIVNPLMIVRDGHDRHISHVAHLPLSSTRLFLYLKKKAIFSKSR